MAIGPVRDQLLSSATVLREEHGKVLGAHEALDSLPPCFNEQQEIREAVQEHGRAMLANILDMQQRAELVARLVERSKAIGERVVDSAGVAESVFHKAIRKVLDEEGKLDDVVGEQERKELLGNTNPAIVEAENEAETTKRYGESLVSHGELAVNAVEQLAKTTKKLDEWIGSLLTLVTRAGTVEGRAIDAEDGNTTGDIPRYAVEGAETARDQLAFAVGALEGRAKQFGA